MIIISNSIDVQFNDYIHKWNATANTWVEKHAVLSLTDIIQLQDGTILASSGSSGAIHRSLDNGETSILGLSYLVGAMFIIIRQISHRN